MIFRKAKKSPASFQKIFPAHRKLKENRCEFYTDKLFFIYICLGLTLALKSQSLIGDIFIVGRVANVNTGEYGRIRGHLKTYTNVNKSQQNFKHLLSSIKNRQIKNSRFFSAGFFISGNLTIAQVNRLDGQKISGNLD